MFLSSLALSPLYVFCSHSGVHRRARSRLNEQARALALVRAKGRARVLAFA